jgi:glycyl-tRNA synthetase
LLSMQQAILRLTSFWAENGCVLGQPINTEVGAGTLNPLTFLRVLGPEPWRTAYVEPSVRPDDSRYGINPNRMQTHTQFQVILKPDPGNPQELYLRSLAALGIDTRRHDVRFVEDNWESPALGAWGLGWEVWLDGLEITQFTYFQQAGGITLEPVSVEITYGLERILMAIQNVSHFKEIRYTDDIAYGEIQGEAELEMSRFYLDKADVQAQRQLFEIYATEARRLIDDRLPLPAHSMVLKCSHTFNVLDSRGAVGTTERARAFARMRILAHEVAELWVERREELGHPLGITPAVEVDPPQALAGEGGPRGPRTLVVELGCEELPPAEVTSLIEQLDAKLRSELTDAQLDFEAMTVSGTPRRIVAQVKGLIDRQPDRVVTVRGPKVAIAFSEDGTPKPAAVGFARQNAMDVGELLHEKIGNATYLVARRTDPGAATEDLLSGLLPKVLGSLKVERSMRWASGSSTAFSRPIRWIVALYGSALVPFTYGPVRSGRTTQLLRDADPRSADLASADDYAQAMQSAGITYDQRERASRIETEARRLAADAGGQIDLDKDAALLDELTNLVESPVTILGRFDEEFLRLPPEVLAMVMKKHQRYLPLRAPTGELMSMFISVANGPVDVDAVREGNEAVLRARFTDAAFFFDRDLESPLEAFRDALGTLTYEERAGSMLDRAERIATIAGYLAKVLDLPIDERLTVERAAVLVKADLTTSMVVELSSLAGLMGSIYARRGGETDVVATAIFEHTLPRHADDDLPRTIPGVVLAIADRVDALTALFAVGAQPSGSNDPYALRRAAAGLAQIIVARDLDIDLDDLFGFGSTLQSVAMSDEAMADLRAFFARRFEQRLLDDGHPAMLVRAVMRHAARPALASRLLTELEALVGSESLAKVGAAYRRAARITKGVVSSEVHQDLFESEAEANLWAAYQAAADKLGTDRTTSLSTLVDASSDLATAIDSFFDDVLVMAENGAVRANRLALLARVRDLGTGLVDWDAVPEI